MVGKRLILITPPYHAGVVEAAGRWPNLGFVYLAGHARAAGFEVCIYDAMTKGDNLVKIEEKIKEFQPDFVGTTGYTSSFLSGLEVLRLAKKVNPDIVTILGGIHATFMYSEILADYHNIVDYIIRGEGEKTLPELLLTLESGGNPERIDGISYWNNDKVQVTPDKVLIKDLDNLLPAWDLVDWEDYTFFVLPGSRLGIVNSSRGCVNNCRFCSQYLFWKESYRTRSPESFVNELLYLRDAHGVNIVMLSDEYPTQKRERWEKILDLLIEKKAGIYILMETCVEDIIRDEDILDKYRKAGVIHIYVGVESTDLNSLKSFRKKVKVEQSKKALELLAKGNIISECSFILGMPGDTKDSIKNTLRLAKEYGPDFAHFLHITPWPYADLYAELSAYLKVWDYDKYNFTEPLLETEELSLEEREAAIFECYKDYYVERMQDYLNIADSFKRDYMLRSLQAMMNNSFLAKHQSVREIPEKAKGLIRQLQIGSIKA